MYLGCLKPNDDLPSGNKIHHPRILHSVWRLCSSQKSLVHTSYTYHIVVYIPSENDQEIGKLYWWNTLKFNWNFILSL
jgi:deoxyhypusine synthase